ncbi:MULTISPECIES: phosphoribosyl-ATP diphosphatase [Thiomicrorhabdus]|uniref:Phosphoribosyl-ATP pyrophosphatase n=1 Tax=Thiomicrorhabdus heinhorstiae TaxID=2748010 RepID=A0ABS0BZD9_9GAMM|nr:MULTISPECIES: phosphoribosyl-ATP diphosphatase [Thiomicrorhabdus]MBF6057452.1 phosphoribosyl-ATP diphosphatase [Thiomicrorhabdus heinhorstiae]
MNDKSILEQLDAVLEARKSESADSSYVASLYAKGTEKILKKISEESLEVAMAAKDHDHSQSDKDKEHLIYEVTDLWFHSLVLLASKNISSEAIMTELQRRFGLSGHDEKASRKDA